MTTRQNARIRTTFLGVEDHGILTFFVDLEGEGWGQGYGGYPLDTWNGTRRVGLPFAGEAIRAILTTLEVESWEKLPGQVVRVEHVYESGVGRTIQRMGHIVKDQWADLGALARGGSEAKP